MSDRFVTDPLPRVVARGDCERLDEDPRFVEVNSAGGESGDVLMVVSGMKMMIALMSPLHWICYVVYAMDYSLLVVDIVASCR